MSAALVLSAAAITALSTTLSPLPLGSRMAPERAAARFRSLFRDNYGPRASSAVADHILSAPTLTTAKERFADFARTGD